MVLCSNTNCKMIEIKIFKWDIFYGRHCMITSVNNVIGKAILRSAALVSGKPRGEKERKEWLKLE